MLQEQVMACCSAGKSGWTYPEDSYESDLSELDALLVQPCAAQTPTVTYLGVSPPVRCGAANPWAHDQSWAHSAYNASHSNLEALRELDSTGESFLHGAARRASAGYHAAWGTVNGGTHHQRGRSGGSMYNADAADIVLSSPDLLPCALAAVAAAEELDRRDGGAGAVGRADHDYIFECFDEEESLSDAGSESSASASALVPPPHAPPSASVPAPSRRPLSAPVAARCGPSPSAASAPLSMGYVAATLAAVPRPAAAPVKQQQVLEPFACDTRYYV